MAEHFCCYLQYFVHVTFATLQRFCSVTPLLQKNTMVLAQNASKTGLEHVSRKFDHFHDNLKKWLFPKIVFLVTIFHIKVKFYRKLKWSVWSIRTYSTRWIFKLMTQKVSFWGKLKIEGFEKLKKLVLGAVEAQNGFSRSVSKTKMTSKYILDHSRPIPTQFPYIKTWFLMEIIEHR